MGVPSGMMSPLNVRTTTCGLCFSCSSSAFSSRCCVGSSSLVHGSRPLHLGNDEQPSHGPRLPRRRFMGEPHFSHFSSSIRSGGGVGYLICSFLSRFTTHLTSG